jgi:hypothetical protein
VGGVGGVAADLTDLKLIPEETESPAVLRRALLPASHLELPLLKAV